MKSIKTITMTSGEFQAMLTKHLELKNLQPKAILSVEVGNDDLNFITIVLKEMNSGIEAPDWR